MTKITKDIEQGKTCAILAWFFPIGLIWYFADEKMKKNKFAQFHVKQSLVLAIVSVLIALAGNFVPIFGLMILAVGNLAVFVFFILGLISAVNGEEKELPFIGKFAEQLQF